MFIDSCILYTSVFVLPSGVIKNVCLYVYKTCQIVTSNKPTPNSLQAAILSCCPTDSVEALKGRTTLILNEYYCTTAVAGSCPSATSPRSRSDEQLSGGGKLTAHDDEISASPSTPELVVTEGVKLASVASDRSTAAQSVVVPPTSSLYIPEFSAALSPAPSRTRSSTPFKLCTPFPSLTGPLGTRLPSPAMRSLPLSSTGTLTTRLTTASVIGDCSSITTLPLVFVLRSANFVRFLARRWGFRDGEVELLASLSSVSGWCLAQCSFSLSRRELR